MSSTNGKTPVKIGRAAPNKPKERGGKPPSGDYDFTLINTLFDEANEGERVKPAA